jgi:murein DD-endopeptidase MepM/ murein hydrolase activator NlpD
MSVVRLCLAAVLLAVVFAVLASVAPAATPGGAAYEPVGGSSGGAGYGLSPGSIDLRPIAASLKVAPHRLRVGHLPKVSFRIRQKGVAAVDVRLRIYRAATRSRSRRLTTNVHVGEVRIGHEISLRWPRRTKLRAGRYVVSLHATDPTGRTLARTDRWPGQTVVTIVPKRRPKRTTAPAPAPEPTPAPTPVTPITAGVFPVQGAFTFGGDDAGFGAGRRGHTHEGQDITAALGTPVVAPTAGTVTFVDFQKHGAGYYVVMRSVDGRDFFLCHFQKGTIVVAPGQLVAAGQPLGAVGRTGDASGPHLHFEIWEGPWRQGGHPVDPLAQLQAWAGGA